jgi:hypothetical protein
MMRNRRSGFLDFFDLQLAGIDVVAVVLRQRNAGANWSAVKTTIVVFRVASSLILAKFHRDPLPLRNTRLRKVDRLDDFQNANNVS